MKKLPSRKVLRELMCYDPTTGVLVWLPRSPHHMRSDCPLKRCALAKSWNKSHAGKTALSYIDSSGYFYGRVFNTPYSAHRIIWKYMTGRDPKIVDHIDGNPSNNRWANLRSVSMKDNMRNMKMTKACTTGHAGVIWYKPSQRWRVRISPSGSDIHVGMFDSFEEAVAARKAAEKRYGFHANHGRKQNVS